MLVNNCKKREEPHVYIEHLVGEPVSLIENIDAEKATSKAVPTVKQADQTACVEAPSGKENVNATENAEKANCEVVN